jgi:hypothetical protein
LKEEFMIYMPEWKPNWWEYCPWIIGRYLDLLLDRINDDDLENKTKESLLGIVATYVDDYIRKDYEEATYIWDRLQTVYKSQYSYGSAIRWYLMHIQTSCEEIIKEYRPNDYPDTFRY